MPQISVLMPAYNAGQYLAQSIESVIKQTFTDWHLIIANDGSTDDTLAIAQSYANKDPRIKIIDNKVNAGNFALMRNLAFSHAQSPYIACLDSDDLYEPHALQTLFDHLDKHPDCPMVYGAFGLIDENSQPITRQPFGTRWNGQAFVCDYMVPATWPNLLLSRVPNQVQAMLFRKTLLDKVATIHGGVVWPTHQPDWVYLGDWYLTLLIYTLAFDTIKPVAIPVFQYRQTPSSMTYSLTSTQKKTRSALAILDWFYTEHAALETKQTSVIYATTLAMHARPVLRMGDHKAFWGLMACLWQHPRVAKKDALVVTAKTLVRGYIQRQ
jgi:glycosyltransferase involved in cell wall biosynthesis